MPSVHKSEKIGKIMILKLEGIIKKFPTSAASRDYESVDEQKRIHLGLCPGKRRKKNGIVSVNVITCIDFLLIFPS